MHSGSLVVKTMPKLEWLESFELRGPEIDGDHRTMLDMMKAVQSAAAASERHRSRALSGPASRFFTKPLRAGGDPARTLEISRRRRARDLPCRASGTRGRGEAGMRQNRNTGGVRGVLRGNDVVPGGRCGARRYQAEIVYGKRRAGPAGLRRHQVAGSDFAWSVSAPGPSSKLRCVTVDGRYESGSDI